MQVDMEGVGIENAGAENAEKTTIMNRATYVTDYQIFVNLYL